MKIVISNFREVLFAAQLTDQQVKALVDHAKNLFEGYSTTDEIIDKVCAYFELSREEIVRKNRLMEYVQARSIIYHRLVKYYGYTLSEAGKPFGKTHATVINGIKKAEKSYRLAYKNIFGEEITWKKELKLK